MVYQYRGIELSEQHYSFDQISYIAFGLKDCINVGVKRIRTHALEAGLAVDISKLMSGRFVTTRFLIPESKVPLILRDLANKPREVDISEVQAVARRMCYKEQD